MLVPATPLNETKNINISQCDHGKLTYNVRYPRYPPDPKVASVSINMNEEGIFPVMELHMKVVII